MTPEIVAVEFDQIECVKEYAFVMAAVADAIERSNAVVITGNRLSVDNAGAGAQAGQGLNDQREAIGEVIARPAIAPDIDAMLARTDTEPIGLCFGPTFGP